MADNDYTHGTGCNGDCESVSPTPSCISGYRHSWTGRGMGGIDSNPGVWALGGTTISTLRRCVLCGMERRERHYGSQRNAFDCDQLSYEHNACDVDDDEASAERERQDATTAVNRA